MQKIILLFVLLFCNLMLQAQNLIKITKNDALTRVSEHNTTIKISEAVLSRAKAEYMQTNAVFLPTITASHTMTATNNPLMAFGSKLNQEILTSNDFDPALLNNPGQVQNYATNFEIQQPLLNLDGLYQRKAAKSKMEATTLQVQRKQDYLMLEVSKAYMQLQLAYKSVSVLEKTLESATSNKMLVDNRYKQGYLQRSDVLNVEVWVTEIQNELQKAKSNVHNVSNYLSFLMNDDSSAVYLPTDSLSVSLVSTKDVLFSENRSDLKAMQLATNAFDAMNKADKMAFLPRLNAFGSYQLYDDQLFQGNANGYLFGAQLSWDIFKGTERFAKVQQSKVDLEKSKLEYNQYKAESLLELNKAKRAFLDAENKLKLTALALEQSEEVLRIKTNRFKEGLEKTSDLLLAETQYSKKQLEYNQTIFEYNYIQAYIEFLTKE